jgi:hypothetical protein
MLGRRHRLVDIVRDGVGDGNLLSDARTTSKISVWLVRVGIGERCRLGGERVRDPLEQPATLGGSGAATTPTGSTSTPICAHEQFLAETGQRSLRLAPPLWNGVVVPRSGDGIDAAVGCNVERDQLLRDVV